MAENHFLRPFQGRKNDPLKLKGGRARDKAPKYFEDRDIKKEVGQNFKAGK